MTKQTSIHAAAAKMVRAELKKHGIAGKVRARAASMMTAIDVDVTDLAPATVRELQSFVGQFEYGSFDGMTDCYTADNVRDIPQVKYAHVHVRYSDELRAAARAHCASSWGGWDEMTESDQDDRVYLALTRDDACTVGRRFWTARKPRVAA